MAIDYSSDFIAFFRDLYRCEGAWGPLPLVPDFLAEFLGLAFKDGQPTARNIMDCRSKKEGKSSLAGCVALYMASRQPYSETIIVAADKDQAKDRVLRAVKYAVENGPLGAHARVYRDVIELSNKSTITAIPADWMGASGANPSCVIVDELHSWVYESARRLWDEMVIPPTQPHGVRWVSSYAGFLNESLLLKEWWDKSLEGERISELPIYYNQGANLLSFIDTGPESWRMPWMGDKYIQEIKAGERTNTFRRLWLNEWVANESQFIPREAWDACYSPDVIPLSERDTRRVVLGVDASTTRDLTALVGTWRNNKTKKTDVIYVKAFTPQRGFLRLGKPTIDLEAVRDEILRLHKAKQLDMVFYDPYQMGSIALELERAGIRMREFPQTNQRILADQGLYDAIIGQQIQHFNHRTLNEHINNAIAIESVRGFRLVKEKTTAKIDLAVALSMSLYGVKKYDQGIIHTMPSPIEYNWGEIAWHNIDSVAKFFIVDKNAPKVHREGVTWHNCKFRNKGCPACIDEMEAEGLFKEDDFYKDPEIIMTSIYERGVQQRLMVTEADRMEARARNAFSEGIKARSNNN